MDIVNLLNKKILWNFGLDLKRKSIINTPDLEDEFIKLYEKCKPYTMTSIERMYGLYNAVKYIIKNNIPGDFVECGVWRGGSTMLIAMVSKLLGDTERKIYLYDTYSGMTTPTNQDVSFEGESAYNIWKKSEKSDANEWCYASLEEVKNNMILTDYPLKKMVFVMGKVEDTIPKTIPSKVSLLRLDTDWYESTYHEMKNLYPILSNKGILIIDDYGYWRGSRKAIDQYFSENNTKPMMFRMDSSGRGIIK